MLVLLNFAGTPADLPLDRAGTAGVGRVLAANRTSVSGATAHLDSLGVLVAEVTGR